MSQVAGTGHPSACPLCGGPGRGWLTATDRNRGAAEGRFHYWRCRSCAVLFLSNPPADLAAQYGTDYYAQSEENMRQIRAAESHRVAMLADAADGGRLVDIGAGRGAFAAEAAAAGYDVTGIEISPAACRHLATIPGVTVEQAEDPVAALRRLPPNRVVTMWHVLEHLPHPWKAIRAVAQSLESGGVMALATPNPDSLQFRLLRSRWAHLDAPRHLFLVPSQALREEAARCGLEPLALTTSDPASLQCDRLGWEYAFLRNPARCGPGLFTTNLAALCQRVLAGIEQKRGRGSAYTMLFKKVSQYP